MESYQERVVEERDQLQGRLEKLGAFIGNPIFTTLDMMERTRLLDQQLVMKSYHDILNQRITAFK